MLLLPLFCCIICFHIQLSDIFGSLAHALRSKVSFLYGYQANWGKISSSTSARHHLAGQLSAGRRNLFSEGLWARGSLCAYWLWMHQCIYLCDYKKDKSFCCCWLSHVFNLSRQPSHYYPFVTLSAASVPRRGRPPQLSAAERTPAYLWCQSSLLEAHIWLLKGTASSGLSP